MKEIELEKKGTEKKKKLLQNFHLEKQDSLKLLFETEARVAADFTTQMTGFQNQQSIRRAAILAEHECANEKNLEDQMQLEDKEVKLEMEKWEIEQRSAKKKKKQHSSKVVDVDAVRQMTKSKLM